MTENNNNILIHAAKAIAVIAVAFLFSACESRQSDLSEVFCYNESNGITSLDPAFARDLEIMWATNQLFDGLVELDSQLKVVPLIARSWEISDDGKKYTFYLRNDVYFHPSPLFADSLHRKVTAHDFVYSFHRIIDPKLASPGQWIFTKVDTTAGKEFEAPNDSTFVVHLKEAFHPFLGMLSTQYCNVVPREVVEHYGPDFRNHPVGTGPFRFAFWYENVALVFHRNDNYWQHDNEGNRLPYLKAVKIDLVKDMSVEFQGLLQGRYDFMSGIHASFKDELLTPQGELNDAYRDELKFQKVPFIKTDYLGFMIDPQLEISKNSPYLNAQVREALECAIDKKQMVKYLRNNTVFAANEGFVPPSLMQKNGVQYASYDLNKAKQLLAEAGYDGGKGLSPITLSTTGDYADLMEYIQHEWEKIGVPCQVQVMQGSTFREATAKGQLLCFRKSWLADYADPENFLSLFVSSNFCPVGPNYTHYSNAQFDEMYALACSTADDSLRYQLYLNMDRAVSLSHVTIPLYYDQVSHFVRSNVSGFSTNPVNMIDLKWVKKAN